MTDRRRILLVRHGVTEWNREGRWQGQLDPPLSDSGRREASRVARRVGGDPELRPARIVSSTLARALETAQVIGTQIGVAVEPDARLMEIGAGEWEGRTHAELETDDADRYLAWRATGGIGQPPGGEPIEAATQRVVELLGDLEAADGGTTMLVSHGGTLRIVARLLFDLGGERTRALDVDNASLSVAARIGDVWRLERWNDTVHLLGFEPTHVDELEGRPLAL
ncbi:MAG TPA: histidine phosphatase family protein [Candidatus Limnocylindrales bacterium]|nr:histidine phosphatase family protein [Candidatus Limnocylindrales bacterium]